MREASPLKQIDGPDPNFKDTCFHVAPRYYLFVIKPFLNQWKILTVNFGLCLSNDASGLSKIFPSVEMVFKSGQSWLLSPENYLFRVSNLVLKPLMKFHFLSMSNVVAADVILPFCSIKAFQGTWRVLSRCIPKWERSYDSFRR